MKAASGNGRYGYGGSWEKTYVSNELAQFVNMFGGDYLTGPIRPTRKLFSYA